jgi:glycerophosphoryl diester phosphodiesterase
LNKETRKLVVGKSTFEELRSLDVGSWKDEKWNGERMPTLAEVMRTVPAGKKIFVEVKCGAEIVPFLRTIDDPKRAVALAAMGIRSITTNRPALIREGFADVEH